MFFSLDVVFATSLMNAALQEQQSLQFTPDNPSSSSVVVSEQQEDFQDITEEENPDSSDGGMTKFYKSVIALMCTIKL